jgi:IS5 family transposase
MGEEKLLALLQESLAVATHRGDAAKRSLPGDHRHHSSTEGGHVPDRCQAHQSGARDHGSAGQAPRRHASQELYRPYEFGVKVSVATPLHRCKGGQFVAHVAALPGNPYDGHTLATVISAMEDMIGNTIERAITDAGYRGHNAPPDYKFKVYTAGQKRRVTPQIKREMKRRSAVEPVIGHLKSEHRMGCNYLAHRAGDAINAVLAAVGYNFRLLLNWLRLLLRAILAALRGPFRLQLA